MKNLPKEILHMILEYDSRIKYRHGEYINIIHKNDQRYTNLKPLIEKKHHIIKNTTLDKADNSFYFEFRFSKWYFGLCYASGGWSFATDDEDKIEICYFNFKNNTICQYRTYI